MRFEDLGILFVNHVDKHPFQVYIYIIETSSLNMWLSCASSNGDMKPMAGAIYLPNVLVFQVL